MSFFAEMESQEPAKRGLFGRLKALTAGFTDSSSSSMPIVGREPIDAGDAAVTTEPQGVREPRFTAASKPVNLRHVSPGQPMTMGMMLRRAQEEAEDVAIIGEGSGQERRAETETDEVARPAHQPLTDAGAPARSERATPAAAVGAEVPSAPMTEIDVAAGQAAEPSGEGRACPSRPNLSMRPPRRMSTRRLSGLRAMTVLPPFDVLGPTLSRRRTFLSRAAGRGSSTLNRSALSECCASEMNMQRSP